VNTYMEVALFHLDFQNQILTASAAGASSSGSVNAGKTLHQGVEAALRYSPPEALQWLFDVNATYVPVAKLNSPRFVGTPALNREGNRLPYAPEYLANLGVGYKTFTWFAGLQYSYVSKQFADFENTEAESASGMVGELPAYGFFNLNADYQFGEDWELSLAVKNLTDEVYINSRAPFGIFPGLRRTAYLSLKMSY